MKLPDDKIAGDHSNVNKENTDSAKHRKSYREIFSVQVVRWRHQFGWTQEELANNSGLSTRYIGDVERRSRNVTIQSMEKLVAPFGVGLEAFWVGPQAAKEETSIEEKINDKTIEDINKENL